MLILVQYNCIKWNNAENLNLYLGSEKKIFTVDP